MKATVLNIFCDQDYNRSVITIAAELSNIGKLNMVFTTCLRLIEACCSTDVN